MTKEKWAKLYRRLVDVDIISTSATERIEKVIKKCITPQQFSCNILNLNKNTYLEPITDGTPLHIDTNVITRIVSGGYCEQISYGENGLSILSNIEKGKFRATMLENSVYWAEKAAANCSNPEVGKLIRSLICQIPNLGINPFIDAKKVARYLGDTIVDDLSIEDRAQVYIAKKEGAVMLSYDSVLLSLSRRNGYPIIITPEQMLDIRVPYENCSDCKLTKKLVY